MIMEIDIFLKNGRFGPYLQYEKILEDDIAEEITIRRKKKRTKKTRKLMLMNY